jgi:hypothetical protein
MDKYFTASWITQQLVTSGLNTTVVEVRPELINESRISKKYRLHLTHATESKALPNTLFYKWSHRPQEAQFYEIVRAHDLNLPIVPCYYTEVQTGGSVILLLDLSSTHVPHPPAQLPPLEQDCEKIIDGLADIHGYWWNHSELESVFQAIPNSNDIHKSIREDAEIYHRFAAYLGDRLPMWQQEIYAKIFTGLPDLLAKRFQTRNNMTLTFEDVHIGNFLYPKDSNAPLYFIDWEQWGINTGANDLAYMMAMFWSPERRSRLEMKYLQRYHDHLTTLYRNITYSIEDLMFDYRLSIMRHMLSLPWNWENGGPIDVWWNHLDRLFSAYKDLHCDGLLSA